MPTVRIGNVEAEPGKKSVGHLTVGALAGGVDIRIPVTIINGAKKGPIIWQNATVQGIEVHGIEICRRIFNEIEPSNLTGTIVQTPISNVTALFSRKYSSPVDDVDLGYQAFPGSANGTFTERVAHQIFNEIVTKVNYAVDHHSTSTDLMDPYTIFTVSPKTPREIAEKVQAMATAFGTELVCRLDVGEPTFEEPIRLQAAMDLVCNLHGVPTIMAEGGPWNTIEDSFVEVGVKGMKNVLKHLGMIEGKVESPRSQTLITERKWIRAGKAGIIRLEHKKAGFIPANTILGRIYDELYREVEIIKTKQDCVALILRKAAVLNTGEKIALVGTKFSKLPS